MISVILLAWMLGGGTPEIQAAPANRAMEIMRSLPDLTGRWTGSGTIRMGGGEPMPFVGEELVETRLDGRLVLVEGKHYLPDRSRLVHHAFGVLSFDESRGALRFRTHLSNGMGGDFPARLENGSLVWEIDSPQGLMRYIITVEDDQWLETGKIERNGEWHDFFEMRLRRVSR